MLMLIGFGMALFLKGHDLASPYGRRVTACAILFMAVAGIGLPVLGYVVAPDWMWMYYVDDREMPGWMPWWIFLLYWLPFAASFLVGARLSRKGQGWVIGAFVFSLVAQVAIILMTLDRYLHIGTTAEYRAGEAVPLPQSEAAVALNIGAVVAAIVLGGIWWYLRKSRRELAAIA